MTQATSVKVIQGQISAAEAARDLLAEERASLAARMAEIDVSDAVLAAKIDDLNSAIDGVNAAPAISSVSPGYLIVGTSGAVLTVSGSGFLGTSSIYINGVAMATTYVSAASLTCVVLDADVLTSGTAVVQVVTPEPGGGSTASYSVPVIYGSPSISSITPPTIAEGSGDSLLLVSGVNFGSYSEIYLNGNAVATTVVGADLRCTVPEEFLSDATLDVDVSVRNPTPGGGSAPSLVLDVV